MKPIKLTEQELKNLELIQLRRAAMKEELSEIGFHEIKIESKKVKVRQFYDETMEMEKKYAEDLQVKYGRGSVDTETGTFTPFN
jgi:hypothetical protein